MATDAPTALPLAAAGPAPTTVNGFLLTRNWRDTASGIELEFWFSSDQGPIQVLVSGVESVFFLQAPVPPQAAALVAAAPGASLRELHMSNFSMQPVVGVYCRSYRAARNLSDRLLACGVEPLEADVNPADRYLMERFITGAAALRGEASREAGFLRLINPTLKTADYQPSLRTVSLDIETSVEQLELYSIAVHARNGNSEERQVFMLGSGARQDYVTSCDSQNELLRKFLAWIDAFDPDVLIGWNVIGFDCDYLQRVADLLNLPLTLGRNKNAVQWRIPRDANNRRRASCPGRVILDGIDLLKEAFYQFESFSLENVSNALLGEGKLIQGNDRGEKIGQLFADDKSALAEYNLRDCRLVSDIFQRTQLLEFALARARMTGLNLDRMGGSVASFDNLYLPRLHRAGYVANNASRSTESSPGGFVLDSLPGIYTHVLVLDFKSLYPSIIRTFRIDPLGLALGTAGGLTDSDTVTGYLGARFARQGHLLPEIINKLWRIRDKAKEDHNAPLSQATKILMNSFYGVLGSPGCRFFDPRLATSITLRGRQILKETRDYIEAAGHRVIYGDTDSVFVWIQDARNQAEAFSTGEALEAELNTWWRTRVRENYGLESFLEVEFETHYRHFLMPTIRGSEKGSKKRYAGVTADGKLIFKGLENVRSDWTRLARNFQEELYRRIFLGQEYKSYIKNLVAEVISGAKDDELVYRKKLRKNLEDYQHSTPPHVKAGRLYPERGLKTPRRGDSITYIVTTSGPEPAMGMRAPIDYRHYIEKQLEPIADGILNLKGESFASLMDSQMALF